MSGDDDDQHDRGGQNDHTAEAQTVVDDGEKICGGEEVTDILAGVEAAGVEGTDVEDGKVVLADDGIGREYASHLCVGHENNHEQEGPLYLVDDESETFKPLDDYDVFVCGGDAHRSVDVGDDVGSIRRCVVGKKFLGASGLVAGLDVSARLLRRTFFSYFVDEGSSYSCLDQEMAGRRNLKAC